MVNIIISLSIGIIIGFGLGFWAVYGYYKEKLLIQEIKFQTENKKLLEDNLLLVKALNNQKRPENQK